MERDLFAGLQGMKFIPLVEGGAVFHGGLRQCLRVCMIIGRVNVHNVRVIPVWDDVHHVGALLAAGVLPGDHHPTV